MTAPADRRGPARAGRADERGFTSSRRAAEHGFTLIEVMVALAIFATIAAAGVAILSFGVHAGRATDARLDDDAALARTVALLSADLAQAVDRPTRDETGAVRASFTGAAGGEGTLLTLVRGGWTNLDGDSRPALQKVGWVLADGALERVGWPRLDGAGSLPPAAMLAGVAAVRLRYRLAGAWSDRWDPARAAAPLPQAAEVTIVRRNGRSWRELFLVGGDLPAPAAPAVPRAG